MAIGTDHWFMLKSPNNDGLPLRDNNKIGRRLLYKYVGLWRSCVIGLAPKPEISTNFVSYSKYDLFKKLFIKYLKVILTLKMK